MNYNKSNGKIWHEPTEIPEHNERCLVECRGFCPEWIVECNTHYDWKALFTDKEKYPFEIVRWAKMSDIEKFNSNSEPVNQALLDMVVDYATRKDLDSDDKITFILGTLAGKIPIDEKQKVANINKKLLNALEEIRGTYQGTNGLSFASQAMRMFAIAETALSSDPPPSAEDKTD
jgi:hypothetical protein